MELIQTIALLCQITHSTALSYNSTSYSFVSNKQVECYQSYLHCVLKSKQQNEADALRRCILEK